MVRHHVIDLVSGLMLEFVLETIERKQISILGNAFDPPISELGVFAHIPVWQGAALSSHLESVVL
jgi:hypothetical protein